MTVGAYRVDALADVAALVREMTGPEADTLTWTPFQSPHWLASWYATMAPPTGAEVCLRSVRCTASGRIAAIVPLIVRRKGPLRIVEAPDLGISDYNGPILGPAAPTDREGAGHLWRALLASLPTADLVHLTKLPVEVGGRANPLALLACSEPSAVFGNILEIGEDTDAFLRSRGRKFRKEYHRYYRRLEERGRVRVRRASGREEAIARLAEFDLHQGRRMRGLGKSYELDEPHVAAHYRELVLAGLSGDHVHLFYLTVDDEPIAYMLGLAHAGTLSVIRLTQAGDAWEQCSPGRIMLVEGMRAMVDQGIHRMDLTIGDYRFKRSFEPAPYPLVDVLQPLGWRGSVAMRMRAARRQMRGGQASARAAVVALGTALGMYGLDGEG